MAVLLAVLSTLSIGVGEFVAANVTKRTNANQVTSTMFAAGVVMTGIVAIIWPGEPAARDLWLGGAAGIANGVAILLIYLAYSRGSLRSAAPAAAVVMSSVPILWDVAVEGSSLSARTWTGLALGVIAIALSSYQRSDDESDERGLALAILAGAIFGVLIILLGEISDDAGGSPIFVQRCVGFAVAAVVTLMTGHRILPLDRTVRAMSFVVGIFATAAIVLMVIALQSGGSLSVVSVIGSQYAAVAVLLGVLFRGQRMLWWQALGLAAASLAVALIALG